MRRTALLAALTLGALAPTSLWADDASPSALAPATTTAAPAPRPARQAASVTPPLRQATPSAPPPTPRPNDAAHVRSVAYAPDRALCGDPRLRGARLPELTSPGQCGIAEPVRLTSVAGVRLARPVTVGCNVGRALADWTEAAARPAARSQAGSDLAAMTPFAGYACRTTNSQLGARLSLHAMGQAIDIGAFTLADGREITVLHGWRGQGAAFLRAAWRGACGPFGTVLGPDADRWHRDHLHLDTARYRSGPYCR